jgi:hypothetical protein
VLVLTAGLDSRPLPAACGSDLVVATVHKPFDIAMLVDVIGAYFSMPPPEPPPAELAAPN